jgi:hypothetical protein
MTRTQTTTKTRVQQGRKGAGATKMTHQAPRKDHHRAQTEDPEGEAPAGVEEGATTTANQLHRLVGEAKEDSQEGTKPHQLHQGVGATSAGEEEEAKNLPHQLHRPADQDLADEVEGPAKPLNQQRPPQREGEDNHSSL